MCCGRLHLGVSVFSVLIQAVVATAVITRDVIIVGGGASGAHAAVWLRDHGKSVVVVEKRGTLGGHTSVYNDPATGKPINIGVQAWLEYLNTTSFPQRMGVSTNGSMQRIPLNYEYIDFDTGVPVSGYVPPPDTSQNAAMMKYLELCEKYADMINPGYFNFPTSPENVPEDLVVPFSQFVKNYGLEAVVPKLWDATVMGLGNFMDVPTIYVMQAFGAPMARALVGQGRAIVPASGNLHELYERVADFLGTDVLYESTVSSSARSNSTVSVTVRSVNGTTTQIVAKRLIVAIEPTAENMVPFNLDKEEKGVFEKFKYTTVYAGLVKHPSLQAGTQYTNTVPGAPSSNYSAYPFPAQVGKINQQPGSNDLFAFTAVGTDKDTTESMQAVIKTAVNNLIASGTIPATKGTIEFPAFANHELMHSRVTGDDIRAGFITRQLALQGKASTWYTGAAWSAGYSTVLWAYNEVLLPKVIAGI